MTTVFTYDNEMLETTCDHVKVVLMKSLVEEKLIDKDVAEEWCKTHTIIIRKKGIFRTISKLWNKEPKEGGTHYYKVVKVV